MAMEITVQVPETLGKQLQAWQGRLPEIWNAACVN